MRFEEVDLGRGLSVKELEELIGARDYRLFLNPRNEMYRARNMKTDPPPREEAIRLMSENPNLVRRPILVRGRHVVLGYEPEEMAKVSQGGRPAESG